MIFYCLSNIMQEMMQIMAMQYQTLLQNLSQNTNVNELFNEYSILCVQLQSSRGVNARHYEMITDRNHIHNAQVNGMMIGVKTAAYRNRIAQLGLLNKEKANRGRLLDIYLSICIDDSKLEIRNKIRNAIVQNMEYNQFDEETKRELNTLLRAYIAESNAILRANPLQHLV